MNRKNDPPPDSYAAFLARLDAATANLITRAASLDNALKAVSLLVGPYTVALRKWERRRNHVGEQLALLSGTPSGASYGSPQTYTALSELHDTAQKMESMLRARIVHLTEKLAVMQGRREAIDKSLLELEVSRAKLHSSRMLSQDRDNLSRAFSELAGPTRAAAVVVSDLGLHSDLKEARQAVILAEALMEVKGY
ncbi:hypothetical protein [Arthrobacter rhizosphaerae]|uniref:hypothetical protein n=1 Tax=Arthrobacter rhizosphaerae TaxID=2855490 RepID=UPI001FF599FC|nr:hypothetical protein [Arthrobacter rhizosphaerae]